MGNVTTVGIDLAKNVFSLHGVDASGAVVLRKTVSRARLMELSSRSSRLSDRAGGVLGSARVGAALSGAGAHGEVDGAAVCRAVPQERQERRQRRRSDLRSGESTEHALRADQDARAASGAVFAPRAPGVHRGTHGDDQSAARTAGGVRLRAAARAAEVRRSARWSGSSICRRTRPALSAICASTFVSLDARVKDYERSIEAHAREHHEARSSHNSVWVSAR